MSPSWFGGKKKQDQGPRNKLIYVLDDDGNIREAIQETLQFAGHRVKTFWSGPELFEALKEELPDLILLDINMPVASGWKVRKLLARFRQTHEIPCIAVTGTRRANAKELALDQLGFVDYIRKPFKPADLVERVNAALAGAPIPAAETAEAPEEAQQAEPSTGAPSPGRERTGDPTPSPSPAPAAQHDASSKREDPISSKPGSGRTASPSAPKGLAAEKEKDTGPSFHVAASPAINRVTQRTLEAEGRRVKVHEGLDSLGATLDVSGEPYVFLEVGHLDDDGQPLGRAITKASTPAASIVLIVEEEDEAHAAWAVEQLGLAGHLVKPVMAQDLVEMVGELLGNNGPNQEAEFAAHA
ncbi:MAG: response regulator transcription factor [Candidatus Thermoplasmatota archaeon]|nr:response regulator transcription factor [Candidatus Thermoplasmatota archaeon]